ncbi:MAG TPA: hypothetical protein VGN05_06685 [Parvibaculum sp.]|jgi:hypothetical protein
MSDLATSAVVASQGQTQLTMVNAMLKASHQQDQAMVDMLSLAVEQGQAQAAAPAGMGALIDTTA